MTTNTPDTEWEKSFGAQLEMRGIYGYPKDSIIEDVRIQLTSRDTYWKEMESEFARSLKHKDEIIKNLEKEIEEWSTKYGSEI